jgi:uncharacterized membrane protein YccC
MPVLLRSILRAGWARRTRALRIGVSFVLPLSIGALLGEVAWGAIATQGAFVAMYAGDVPYRKRARVLAGVGVGLAVTMAIGTLAAPHPWLAAVLAGPVVASAALLCLAFEVGPPREFMPTLSYLVAISLPVDPGAAPERAGVVLLAAALVGLVALAGALRRPRGPEEDAVREGVRAVADLLERVVGDEDEVDAARQRAVLAVRDAAQAMRAAGDEDPARRRLTELTIALEAVLDAAVGLALRQDAAVDPAWPAALRALAESVDDPSRATPVRLPDDAPDTPPGHRLEAAALALRRAADPARRWDETFVPFAPRHRPRALASLRRALRPSSLVVPTAARNGVAAAAGVLLGLAIGVERGAWVGLTAVAVLQASNVRLTARRTAHRMLGTGVGVVAAAAILAFHPAVAVVIVVMALCQTIGQAFIKVAYGAAVAFVTPIALLVFDLGQPGAPVGSLLGARLLDTALGCVVGLAARRFLWPQTARTRLPTAQAAVIEAVGDVLHAAAMRPVEPSGVRLRQARRRLQTALLNLRAVQADALGDLAWRPPWPGRRRGAQAEPDWATTLAVTALAHAAMAAPARPDGPPPDPTTVAALDAAIAHLAATASGLRAPAWVALPRLRQWPRTSAALAELRDRLAGEDAPAERPLHATGAPLTA